MISNYKNQIKTAELKEDFSLLPSDPLVTIRCITYNHANFISEALEGFLMQQTDFPFEILIHDDASTDGTAEIIRNYQKQHPDLIRAVYQTENQYSKGLRPWRKLLYEMTRGKYIALCEGDDYWTDPLKLQKQVDFLETHPNYNISFHKVKRIREYNQQKVDFYPNFHDNNSFSKIDLYWNCFIQTCSVVHRNQPMADFFKKSSHLSMMDWPLFVFLAQNGDIGFLEETMAVYRIHSGGINSSATRLHNISVAIEALKFFRSYERISDHPMIKKSLARYYYKTIEIFNEKMDRPAFRKALFRCLRFARFLNRRQMYQIVIMFMKIYFPWLFSINHHLLI